MSQGSKKVSVPGKILLSGEYAVLDGAEAVVMAVNRRAYAHLADEPQKLSPFLRAVREELAEVTAFGGVGRAAIEAARHVVVDTSRLQARDGTKLGLGSSAAATVAAAACALTTESDELRLDLVQQLAHRAHGNAQRELGGSGSGADVAACTHGGVLAVCADPQPDEPVSYRRLAWPAGAHMVVLWTGTPADTASLLARVREFRLGRRHDYDRTIARLANASDSTVQALESGQADALVSAVREGALAIAEFGKQARLDLAPKQYQKVAELAEKLGGAAKPTGAGAGDLIVAVFTDADNAQEFARKVASKKVSVLDDIAISEHGVRIE